MDFSPTEDQRRLREEIVSFARRELSEGAAERDSEHRFPRELWRKCGELRLQGLSVPEGYGGRGLDPLSTAIAIEALGYGCPDGGLVFAICAHLLACVVPIDKYGTEEQKRRYLPGLSDGTLIAANGMTEAGSGSDAFAMATRAERDGDGYRLNGCKIFTSNGPVADLVFAYAMTEPAKGYHGGISAFLVPTDAAGFRTGQTFKKMGLRTCPMGEVVFDNMYLPADAVVGQVGAGGIIFAESMEWERVCLVAAHVGTMERLLEQTIRHARTHKVKGQPIGKSQGVSHRIADMKVRLEAARLLTYRAASRLDRCRDVAMDASIAKLFASESLVAVAQDAVQTFGLYGVLEDAEVERALRDAVASTLYSGTSQIQRNIVARWLGL
jgi:alkylation response protein AidB-like acyl-CoA dehydrogenase